MKKLLLSILGLISANFICAENILQVKPCTIESGYTENDYDEDHMFSIDLTNDVTNLTGIQFDMYLPDGLSVLTDIELSDERFEGKIVKKVWTPYATAELTDKGSGHYLFTLYDSDLKTISGTSGTIIKFYYQTTQALNNTICPILIKDIVLKPVEGSDIEIPNSSSYLKVGTPAMGNTLALQGEIPSFVNEELAKETCIERLDLSAVTKSNGTFAYVDGRNVVAPSTEVHSNVVYNRPYAGSNKYASLVLPFDATLAAYTFDGIEGDYAKFTEVSTLAANTPAIVDFTNGISVAAENVVLGGAEEGKAVEGNYYLKNDKFCSVNVSAVIPAFRGTWRPGSSVKGFMLDDATVISSIGDNENGDIYNISGVKLNKAQRGVNIVAGKKLLVK